MMMSTGSTPLMPPLTTLLPLAELAGYFVLGMGYGIYVQSLGLHKWKHETLLSVAGGTLCYVLLVQQPLFADLI